MKWLWEFLTSLLPAFDIKAGIKLVARHSVWALFAAGLLWYGATYILTPALEEQRADRIEFRKALIKTNDALLETTKANTDYLRDNRNYLKEIRDSLKQ